MAKIKLAPLKKSEGTKSSSRPLPPFKLEYAERHILDNLGPRIDRIEDQETRERLIKKYTSIMDRWGVNYIVGSSCDLDAGSTTTDSLERT